MTSLGVRQRSTLLLVGVLLSAFLIAKTFAPGALLAVAAASRGIPRIGPVLASAIQILQAIHLIFYVGFIGFCLMSAAGLAPRIQGIVGLVGLASLPLIADDYLIFIGNLLAIFVILSVGLNLLVGYCGQLAFSNAAVFGIGAYGAGLLKVHFGWPFFLSVPAGALLATAIGLAMAFPALRLSGLYLALATLSFAQFTQWVFLHWEKVTFGAGGFRTARPDFMIAGIKPEIGTFYVTLVVAVVLVFLATRIVRSRVGRGIIAVRDGEVAAESLGVDLLRYKALAFGLSAFYAGIAGGLNTMMLAFVAPESYDLFQMVLHKAMIVLGGMGSIAGSVIGSGIVLFLLEGLRAFKSVQEIAFGVVLLACVIFAPTGLAGYIGGFLESWRERYVRGHPKYSPASPASMPPAPPAAASAAPVPEKVS